MNGNRPAAAQTKKPALGGLLCCVVGLYHPNTENLLLAASLSSCRFSLLDLRFLENNMLAHHRIVLLEFELVRRVLLIFGSRVEKAGIGGRY
jgi:hypothetical protein